VLAILLIWPVVLGVAEYRQAVTRTKEATLTTQLFRIRNAIDAFRRDRGSYPMSLDALVEAKYLRKVPEDPFTNSAATWRIVGAVPASGVSDVKSGAPGCKVEGC